MQTNPVTSILRGNAQLEHFVSERVLVKLMPAMRWRMIRVFAEAGSSTRRCHDKRDRSSYGYITGLDNHLDALAAYIARKMGPQVLNKVYAVDNLPDRYRRETKHNREIIASYVCGQLILRQLLLMKKTNTLWRLNDAWSVPQNVLDEYSTLRKRTKQSWRYDKSWHGRSRRDRKNGCRPGVSVGAPR